MHAMYVCMYVCVSQKMTCNIQNYGPVKTVEQCDDCCKPTAIFTKVMHLSMLSPREGGSGMGWGF